MKSYLILGAWIVECCAIGIVIAAGFAGSMDHMTLAMAIAIYAHILQKSAEEQSS